MSRNIPAPGTECCGCCEGIEASTPVAIANRTGLSAIAYRIGEYASFKESLLSGLSSSTWRPLGGLRTRDDDDFSIGLIDAVSCAADVLTFYQERLANESFLRTATERVSIQEMAKLVGYRLRPGVAAETRLAFALETPTAPPPTLPPEPGAFVTGIPARLTLGSGLKVQSVPGPGEKPQTFETVEQIEARPEWNAVRPWLSEVQLPGFGATDTWLKGTRTNLKVGDALVFVGSEFYAAPTTDNHWDFRLIGSVDLDIPNDRTHVTWKQGLGSVMPPSGPPLIPQVYALRKRAGVFGNNAPMWLSMNSQFRKYYPGTSTNNQWPDFTISTKPASATGGFVDLDAVLSEVSVGSLIVLAKEHYVELYQVATISEVSRAAFALSAKVSRLGLVGQNLATKFFGFVRETSVFAQSEPLPLAEYPVVDDVAGASIPVAVPPEGLLPGRRLVVRGERVDGGGTLVAEGILQGALPTANGTVLTIAPPLVAPLRRDTVVVHANVALATHGETVSQILGSGDASQEFQHFELKRPPLTYRSAAGETGADSELTVRVGDVEWTEKPTLFGAAPAERAYVLSTDEQGRPWVAFGDGVRGSRLPSGVNNIRATYRQGLGRDGNVARDQLTQLMTRPLGLKSASNPVAAQGGTDPETAVRARRTIPLGTRTLGRTVSLLDYEDFARAYTGVAKAQAAVLHLAAGPAIVVTIAGEDGAVISTLNPVWDTLGDALRASGDPNVSVTLVSHQPSTFRLGLKVKRDPSYAIAPVLDAVEQALRDAFSFDARELGRPVLASEVVAVVHSVPGVVALDLDFLYGGTAPSAQTVESRQNRLLASRMRVSNGVALPAELLTLDPGPLDRLEEMP